MKKRYNKFTIPAWFTRFVTAFSFAISCIFIFFAIVSYLNEYMGFNLLDSALYNWSFVAGLAIAVCLRTVNSENLFYNSWKNLHIACFLFVFFLLYIAIYCIPGLQNELSYFLLKV